MLIALTHSVAVSTVFLAAVGAAASTVLLATIAFTSQYYALIAQHIALGMTIGIMMVVCLKIEMNLFIFLSECGIKIRPKLIVTVISLHFVEFE